MLSDFADRTRKLMGKAAPGSEAAPSAPAKEAPKAAATPPPAPPAAPPPAADPAAPQQPIKIVDERSMALSGGALKFTGQVLTIEGSALKVTPESRNYCALFDNGMWLVSAAHRNSPLVTSVASQARRQGYKVDEPYYVTPNIVQQAYAYAERQAAMSRLDDNAVRRKIVDMIQRAADMGANDIHIEAAGGRAKVEFRVDGALRLWETWTQREGEQVLSAVYSHSIGQSGATANWLEPQAAMLAATGGQESIQLPIGVPSLRCQWVPLADGGRYLNMRLQYDSAHLFGEGFVMADVNSIGFSQEQLKTVRFLRALPGGMRIFSGPVNQGKTTTLRVMLNRRMVETDFDRKCYLIEDPPEGGVMGSSQIGVSASVKEEQRDRSFAEVMRSALRLDPDIVMLGEIRDIQTAKFAFRLALSGRQIYTTLHVYSALAIPRRLLDIGIEPYLVYDPHLLCGMFCQRLLRGVCTHCRIPIKEAPKVMGPNGEDLARRVRAGLALMAARRIKADPAESHMERLVEPDMSSIYIPNTDGCPKCYQGRSGRTVCAEVAEVDLKLMGYLEDGKLIEAEEYWLSPHGLNGITMAWHALEKIRRGEVAPGDAEVEVGPLARERDIMEVEQRLGSVETMNMGEFSRSYAMWRFRTNRKIRYRLYRKLQGMLAMNEALSRALERLWYNSSEMGEYPNRPAAMALREWLQKDRAGQSLSEAMAGWVPSAELYMIRAGEESGTVAKSLRAIMLMGESAKQMRAAVSQAVTYPLFMILLISGVLWMFGVNLIQNMRKNAPKNVLDSIGPLADVSDFVMTWGLPILLSLGMLIILITFTLPYWRGPLRAKFDRFPPWSWFRIWQGSGFMLGLSALMGAQVPMRRALEILESQGNPWICERLNAAIESVLQGKNLGEALRANNFGFPDPQVALDMEILSERGDIGAVIEEVTYEWIKEQIEELQAQSVMIRNGGLAVVGATIAFAMMSILQITVALTDGSKGGGSGGF